MTDKPFNKPLPVSSPKTSVASEAGAKLGNIAGDVAGKTKDLSSDASATARDLKDTITTTASDLMDRAKDIASEAGDDVADALEEKKTAGVDRAKDLSDAIRRAAGELEKEFPPAAIYIRRAADEIENVADAVRRRDVRQLVGDVQDFARRQPTAFLGATVLGGFALVRLLKTSTGRGSSTTAKPLLSRNLPSTQFSRVPDRPRTELGSGDPGGVAQQAPTFGIEAGSGSRKL